MTGRKTLTKARTFARMAPWRVGVAVMGLSIAALMAQAAWAQDDVISSHGYSFYGDLKYPADYPHFDYENPEAPMCGEI